MNIVLWVFQVLLAVAFFAHGAMMVAPPAAVAAQMNASLPRWFQLFLEHRGTACRRGARSSRTHANPAVAGQLGGGRDHHRDGLGDWLPSCPRRGELGGDDARPARDGGVRCLHAVPRHADRRPACGLGRQNFLGSGRRALGNDGCEPRNRLGVDTA